MARVKAEARQINKRVSVVYELILINKKYGIRCTEKDRDDNRLDYCYVADVTRDEKRANLIFDSVVKNRVCACTLLDVITDLIC